MSDTEETPLVSAQVEEAGARYVEEEKTGFLPIETNWFDRLFISVVIWVALSLFWFRFIEPMGVSIWISNVIAFLIATIIIRKG